MISVGLPPSFGILWIKFLWTFAFWMIINFHFCGINVHGCNCWVLWHLFSSLVSWKTFKLFSWVFMPFYNSVSSVCIIQFLHILGSIGCSNYIYLFTLTMINMWQYLMVALIYISWWLVVLSIIIYAHAQSVQPHW